MVESAVASHRGVVQDQRDALARVQRRLLATIRRLEAENASLWRQLDDFTRLSDLEKREREFAAARQLERERGIAFEVLPEDVYPGRPYVTQQELIRRGVTRYSRQNLSRLAREEGSIPAMLIADRVLLPPDGVRALIERERRAIQDVSPRRRPGGSRVPGAPRT